MRCVQESHDEDVALSLKERVASLPSVIQAQREAAAHEAEQHRLESEASALAEARDAELSRMSQLGSSCNDLATMDREADSLSDPDTAAAVREFANTRRSEKVKEFHNQIVSLLAMWLNQPDPTTARANKASVMTRAAALIDQIRCYSATDADWAQQTMEENAIRFEQAIETEESCRKTPRCLADRQFLAAMCPVVADRQDAARELRESAAQMQRERSNPSGIVDLVTLHDLGENIQDAQDRIAADNRQLAPLTAKYSATAHEPFREQFCEKKAETPSP